MGQRLLGVDYRIGIVHGGEALEETVHAHFIVFGKRAVGPAAYLGYGALSYHHSLTAHVHGYFPLGAVDVGKVVELGIGQRRTVGEYRPVLARAEKILYALARKIYVAVVFERVVEFGKIVGRKHGIRIDYYESVVAVEFALVELLEVAVDGIALALLVAHDEHPCAVGLCNLYRGVVRLVDDDVDVVTPSVIVLHGYRGEEIAYDLALAARGNDDGYPSLCRRRLMGYAVPEVKTLPYFG